MQAAKDAVQGFLHHGNKHSVDIEQEARPAVVHERVAQRQHEDVTEAVDREVHQHHHQIHVQPIKDKVVEPEQHHHNVIAVEHRHKHHGKDHEVQETLAKHQAGFRDEREVLPTETSTSNRVVVGEHVHHHIHDVIQPVIERDVVQPHVVHTTIPIHEKIEHEPFIHKGNVLPTMTMDEFTRAGHSIDSVKTKHEHIDYEGEPLKIDGKSHVGFGHLTGGHHGTTGTTGTTGLGGANTTGTGVGGTGIGSSGSGYTHERGVRDEMHNHSHTDDSSVPRSMDTTNNNSSSTSSGTSSGAPLHKSSLLNKLDPRVKTDTDGTRV